MADYTYRFNPDPEKLKAKYGEGYTVTQKNVTTGKGKKKKTSKRWVVTPPKAPSLDNKPTDDDPLGIKKVVDAYNRKQDTASTAHQAYAGDVRKLLESSLQTIYNAREASNTAYQNRMRELAPPAVGQNAPTVGSASGAGAGGAVTDPNQSSSNALTAAQGDQARALQSLAALQGNTANLNRSDAIIGQLKNYDYYMSQIPSLYNEKKTKYETELTNAVLDIEGKKEIAQIGADARTYAAQQNLIGALAGVQGQNSRAVIQALTGMYNNDQDNETSVANTAANNATRERISANQISNQWRMNAARIQAAQQQAARKGAQSLRQFNVKQWRAFLEGKPGIDNLGVKLFDAPGAITPGRDLLKSSNVNNRIAGARQWLQIATKQLNMSPVNAMKFIESELGGRAKAAPILRRAAQGI